MNLTGPSRILQLHPTRRCNLRCLHCYSDSGPEATDALPEAVAVRAVHDAAELGYTVLSVSGGEPFLYRPLRTLLETAKAAGMRTQVITNGLPLSAPMLASVADVLDLLAVSIDGTPAAHDRMRNSAGAFDRLVQRLPLVRDSGIAFGFLFTLTMFNVQDLEWAASFAVEQGARLLQVHPLGAAGRGASLPYDIPDRTEASVALFEAARLQSLHRDRLHLHVDVTTAGALDRLLIDDADATRADARLADALSPLVIEPDGTCVPLEYGFDRRFALGDITRQPLRDLADRWMADVLPSFRDAARHLRRAAGEDACGVVLDPYERFQKALSITSTR